MFLGCQHFLTSGLATRWRFIIHTQTQTHTHEYESIAPKDIICVQILLSAFYFPNDATSMSYCFYYKP